MKRIFAVTFFAMASLFLLGGALAEAEEVRAKVPFDFMVGNQMLPAGSYRVFLERSLNGTNTVEIQNEDQNISARAMTSAVEDQSGNDSKLIFTSYGDQYFLHEVLCSSGSISVDLPTSKVEERVRTREAQLQNSGRTVAAEEVQ
jgi:hypothetical protein